MQPINITLVNGGQELPLTLPGGTEAGHVRTLRNELEELGAPYTFKIAVNGVQVEDSHILQDGDSVSARPLSGEKQAA